MDDDNQNSQWKVIQRTWKDMVSRCSRKCRIPKQLIVFTLIITGVVLYTVLNNKVLRISDELLSLQKKADIKESFESRAIEMKIPKREESLLVSTVTPKESTSIKKKPIWGESAKTEHEYEKKKAARAHLREQSGVSNPENSVAIGSNITIEGTLSQILPTIVSDEERDPAFSISYRFKYPAFVIPPPFTVETNPRNTLPVISRFFQELSSHKKEDCIGEDICVQPSKYVHLYTNWDCKEKTCQQDNDYIVYFQPEYTTGSIDIMEYGSLPFNYDCNCYSDYKQISVSSSAHKYEIPGTVVYLLVSNGATFHHFVDSVLPKLLQMESILNDPSIRFLVDLSPQYPIVEELYDRLGITAKRRIDYRSIKNLGDVISAQRLVLSCKTPPLHPYLWQRAQYLLKLPHIMFPNQYLPSSIIYLSRRKGTLSGGRRVTNEGELEQHLKQFAQNNGYNYVPFFHTEYKTLEATMELWSTAVAVIGPHGGAFTNMLFAPKGTTVVEFLPNGVIFTGRTFKEHLAPYQQAMALGHKYYAVMSQFSKRDDIVVNIHEVLDILNGIQRQFYVCIKP